MNSDITKQMEMVLYRTEDDNVTVSALIKDETKMCIRDRNKTEWLHGSQIFYVFQPKGCCGQ